MVKISSMKLHEWKQVIASSEQIQALQKQQAEERAAKLEREKQFSAALKQRKNQALQNIKKEEKIWLLCKHCNRRFFKVNPVTETQATHCPYCDSSI